MNTPQTRPAGYSYLLKKFQLNAMPHWHISSITTIGIHRSIIQGNLKKDIYPNKYWPGEGTGDHLEFALKYDGLNLYYMELIFNVVEESEIVNYILSKPTGKYTRRIWFFYELLTGKQIPIDDLTMGNYTEALEPDRYYVVTPGERVQRQRIINNLLGNKYFCPIIRKTEKLKKLDLYDLRNKCENIIESYPPELLKKALSYLYNKETKSSFKIENIIPKAPRAEKFISLLGIAEKKDFCSKELFIELQNRVVDPRFKDMDYRRTQNYIGQTVSFQQEVIHYICPKPDDLEELMDGLIESHKLMKAGNVSSIIHAAAIAYGFVFLHPFEDGNGRIHRFLIHNILSTQGLVPNGLMFPVSATMLKSPEDYDNSLEAFSRLIMQFIEYNLDKNGKMLVLNDTVNLYRYIDMTAQAEILYDFVIRTIETELVEELNFLTNYSNVKRAIKNIIDMSDRLIDLFIQLCLQNGGKISIKKRDTYFDFLTKSELMSMEQAVRDGYKIVLSRDG